MSAGQGAEVNRQPISLYWSAQSGYLEIANESQKLSRPVIEFYLRDVDRTLLRENLKLTRAQRLEKFVRFSAFASTLRREGLSRATKRR